MWINESTREVFTAHADIRRSLQNVSLPAQIADAHLAFVGIYPVEPVAPPAADPISQVVEQGAPEKVDGAWRQTWVVRTASVEEAARRAIAIRDEIVTRTQERLDAFAQSRGYDDVISACSYAVSDHPRYGVEGRYCVAAREQTWDALFAIMAQVEAGLRATPAGFADVEAELPTLAWPT